MPVKKKGVNELTHAELDEILKEFNVKVEKKKKKKKKKTKKVSQAKQSAIIRKIVGLPPKPKPPSKKAKRRAKKREAALARLLPVEHEYTISGKFNVSYWDVNGELKYAIYDTTITVKLPDNYSDEQLHDAIYEYWQEKYAYGSFFSAGSTIDQVTYSDLNIIRQISEQKSVPEMNDDMLRQLLFRGYKRHDIQELETDPRLTCVQNVLKNAGYPKITLDVHDFTKMTGYGLIDIVKSKGGAIEICDESFNVIYEHKRTSNKYKKIYAVISSGHILSCAAPPKRTRKRAPKELAYVEEIKSIKQLDGIDRHIITKNPIDNLYQEYIDTYNAIPATAMNGDLLTIYLPNCNVSYVPHFHDFEPWIVKYRTFSIGLLVQKMCKEFGSDSWASNLNKETFNFIKDCPTGCYREGTKNYDTIVDLSRNHEGIILNYQFPVFNGLETVEPFDGKIIGYGLYYVTAGRAPILADNVYIGYLVEDSIRRGVISANNVKLQCISTASVPFGGLAGLPKKFYQLFAGVMGMKRKRLNKFTVTDVKQYAYYRDRYNARLSKDHSSIPGVINMEYDSVFNDCRSLLPIRIAIIHISYMLLFKLVDHIESQGFVINYKCVDDVRFFATKEVKLLDGMKIKKGVGSSDHTIGCFIEERSVKRSIVEPIEGTLDSIDKYHSCHINSGPGYGKSYIARQLQQLFPEAVTLAHTNIAAENVKGITLSKYYGLRISGGVVPKMNHKFVEAPVLIIDECYLIPENPFYTYISRSALNGARIFAFGDSNQISPPGAASDEKRILFWKKLCGVSIQLTHNYRCNDNLHFDLHKYPTIQLGIMTFVGFYNIRCKRINRLMFEKYGYKRFTITKSSKSVFRRMVFEELDQGYVIRKHVSGQVPFKPDQEWWDHVRAHREPGYAIVIDSYQGIEIDEPFVIMDINMPICKKKIYTAVTRAKQSKWIHTFDIGGPTTNDNTHWDTLTNKYI